MVAEVFGFVDPNLAFYVLQAEVFGLALPTLLVLAGLGLVVMEAMAPGAHFIVAGVALLVAGLIGLALGGSFPIFATPFALAAMVLVVGGITAYVYREFDFYGGSGQEQTSDSDSLKGATGRVTEHVTATAGEVKLEEGGFNPYYRARSYSDDDIPEGTEVVVIDPGGGNVVTVMSMEDERMDEIDRELARSQERSDGGETDPDTETETETEST